MNKTLRSAVAAALLLCFGLCGYGETNDQSKEGVAEALPTAAIETTDTTEMIEPAADLEESEQEEAAEPAEPTEETEQPEGVPDSEDSPVPEGSNEASNGDSEAKEEVFCVLEADWNDSDIQTIFARGVVATITDVNTGISWQEVRRGGTNHADVQPCTAEDTAKLKKVYGGDWSWKRRAIWVTIDGKTYAASMNGMPHGQGSVSSNKFDGHHCIHFTNSRTHSSKKIDTNHQKMVQKALRAAQQRSREE